MGLSALAADLYFWVGLVLFLLSLAGIFWILKSLQKESNLEELGSEESWETPKVSGSEPAFYGKTARVESRLAQVPANMETLAGQIALIEGVIPRNLHIGAREGKQRFLLDGRQE